MVLLVGSSMACISSHLFVVVPVTAGIVEIVGLMEVVGAPVIVVAVVEEMPVVVPGKGAVVVARAI